MTWQDPFLAGPYEQWPWLLVDSSSCVFFMFILRTYTALSEHPKVLITMLWLLAVAAVATDTRTECTSCSGKRLLLGL